MKRTALKRKTPMARGKPMAKKSKTKRQAREGADEPYLDFVRAQECASCRHPGPSHAHHKIGGKKGLALKAPDRETLALCWACHRALHDCKGRFEYMTSAERLVFQEYAIEHTQARWAIEQADLGVQLGYQLAHTI